MAKFRASTQYGDWIGTAAADEHTPGDFVGRLKRDGIVQPDHVLVGLRLHIGEAGNAYVKAIIVNSANYDNAVEAIRHGAALEGIDVELTQREFFQLFKRFDLALHARGIDITDHDYAE